MSYFTGSVEHFWDNYNKGKKMNEATQVNQGFNTEFNGAAMKAALDAATVTEVTKPLSEPATMEFKSETAPWEAVQTESDINP